MPRKQLNAIRLPGLAPGSVSLFRCEIQAQRQRVGAAPRNSVALADVDLKQWRPLLVDLIVSLPPYLAADRPSWPGAAAPRLARKVTFVSLTRAQRADVARLYAIGVPVGDVCARFNITKNTVIRLRKQAGVPQRHRGLDEPQGDEAEAMYASGTSPMAIACGDSPPGRLRAARSSRRIATSAKRTRPPRMSLPPIKPA